MNNNNTLLEKKSAISYKMTSEDRVNFKCNLNIDINLQILLSILLAIPLFIYIYFFIRFLVIDIQPTWFRIFNDGACYYLGAKSFFETNSLHGAVLHKNTVSMVGDFYFHGFAYSWLNGSLAKIIGWHYKNIILFNSIYLLTAFCLILRSEIKSLSKKLIIFLIFTFPIVPMTNFSYLQESINILFSVITALFLYNIYKVNSQGSRIYKLIFFYILLITVASIFRPTWLFWSLGLVPLAKNRIQFVLLSLVSAVSVLSSLVLFKLLYAPYPYGVMYMISDKINKHQLFDAFYLLKSTIIENFNVFFQKPDFEYEIYFNYMFLYLTIYLFFTGVKHKNRLFLAVSSIGLINILATFLLFDAGWPGFKQLFLVYILYLIVLAFSNCKKQLLLLVIPTLIIMPNTYTRTFDSLKLMRDSSDYSDSTLSNFASYNQIAVKLKDEKLITIFISAPLLKRNKYYTDLFYVPFKTQGGSPIRYSFEIYDQPDIDKKEFDKNFIDYIISEKLLNRKDVSLVTTQPLSFKNLISKFETPNYYLYKLLK